MSISLLNTIFTTAELTFGCGLNLFFETDISFVQVAIVCKTTDNFPYSFELDKATIRLATSSWTIKIEVSIKV